MDANEAPITFERIDSESVPDWLHDCWQDIRCGDLGEADEAVLIVAGSDRIRVFYCGHDSERETLRLISYARMIVKARRCG